MAFEIDGNLAMRAVYAYAPIWELWQRALAHGLQRTRSFYVEQTAFNFAMHTRSGWHHQFLPSVTNWNCTHSVPWYDTSSAAFVAPFLPHERLGIVHLCGVSPKEKKFNINLVGAGQGR